MKFFTPTDDFTHQGSFYGVPVYFRIDTFNEDFMVAGTNVIADKLFQFATWFHNFFVERFTQMFAALSGRDYEPGFPFKVKYELHDA